MPETVPNAKKIRRSRSILPKDEGQRGNRTIGRVPKWLKGMNRKFVYVGSNPTSAFVSGSPHPEKSNNRIIEQLNDRPTDYYLDIEDQQSFKRLAFRPRPDPGQLEEFLAAVERSYSLKITRTG